VGRKLRRSGKKGGRAGWAFVYERVEKNRKGKKATNLWRYILTGMQGKGNRSSSEDAKKTSSALFKKKESLKNVTINRMQGT